MLRRSEEKDADSLQKDRYLITYADLITLLLGLFVILYAASQVDEEKYKEFSAAFSEYFKSTKEQVLQGGGGVLQGHKNGIPEPIMPNPSNKSLQDISNETKTALKAYIERGTIGFEETKGGIVLTLPEKLLFKSGKAEIEHEGQNLLDTLAVVLSGIPYQLTVDGHSDSTPIRTFRYESNWHLSVARALNVGYALIQKGIPEHNMVIRGFGSQRPVAENSSEEGRARNRRVEITISEVPRNIPSDEGYNVKDTLGR